MKNNRKQKSWKKLILYISSQKCLISGLQIFFGGRDKVDFKRSTSIFDVGLKVEIEDRALMSTDFDPQCRP